MHILPDSCSKPVILADDNSGVLSHVGKILEKEKDYKIIAAIGAGGSAYVVKSRLSVDLFSAIKAVLSDKLRTWRNYGRSDECAVIR